MINKLKLQKLINEPEDDHHDFKKNGILLELITLKNLR